MVGPNEQAEGGEPGPWSPGTNLVVIHSKTSQGEVNISHPPHPVYSKFCI